MTGKSTRIAGWLAIIALLLVVIASGWWYWQARNVDLLIVNGLIVDGTGQDPYRADVAIRQGKIVGISRWRYIPAQPKRLINAEGQVVAPGFIDVHTHIEDNLPQHSVFEAANFLKQGVTTLITGNCGRSRTDIAKMFATLEEQGTRINVATLVGHNSARKAVLGQAARAASADELQQMQRLVERAMEEGAIGLSTGLAYAPGRFAQTNELIYLARAAAAYGGMYVSHIRSESHDGEAAIREALTIGQTAQAQTHISHMKCSGRSQWHLMKERLRLLDTARDAGLKVSIDVYPYDRSSTTTDILLPDWALADKRQGLRRCATDKQARLQLREAIRGKLYLDGWQDLRYIRLVSGRKEWIGRAITEVPAPAATLDQQIENLIQVSLSGGAQAIYADMNEEDMRLALSHPFCVIGSDSAVRDAEADYKPHPRGMGTFPRIFHRYVQQTPQLSLSEAVRKASGQAAELFGLSNRGHVRIGEWADIVIFDPALIEDRADYEQPFAEPVGIACVIVNGLITVEQNSLTHQAPSGQALRHIAKVNIAVMNP
jgi:N-acyl-D-amino-acid deacylase